MIKILVHMISQQGKLIHDKYHEEIGLELLRTVRVYSNTKDLDFSDIRYWKVMEDLKKNIEQTQQNSEVWTYWGDFDEKGCREKLDVGLASCICDKLNGVIGEKVFEVSGLRPYRETQNSISRERIFYYNPTNSECCYDVTEIFLNYPSTNERYRSFLVHNTKYLSMLELERQILRLSLKLKSLKDELNKVQKECNIRVEAFCEFIVPYIEGKIPSVNDVVDMYPSGHGTSVYFKEEGYSSYRSKFYPLNIAFELNDKELRHKLLEYGAYKLSAGHFEDSKNNEKTPIKHSIENLLAQCDDEDYCLLKKNLKEHSVWNDEFEARYPDRL